MPPIDPRRPETFTKDLVQHLSKEIETTTNNMMAFRTRIGFSLCIGPFLLLGSLIVGTKGQPVTRLNWYYIAPALVGIVICYLGIAYITSQIELQALEQCNKWRRLIRDISKTPSMKINDRRLEPHLGWRVRIRGRVVNVRFRGRVVNGVTVAYLVGYFLLFLAVIVAAVIISAGTQETKTYSDNGVNVRIEEVTPTSKPEQVTPTPQVSQGQ